MFYVERTQSFTYTIFHLLTFTKNYEKYCI